MEQIEIFSSQNFVSINSLQSILTGNNIESFINNESFGINQFGMEIGGKQLAVNKTDYDEALFLLKDHSDVIGKNYRKMDLIKKINYCPSCNSRDIVANEITNFKIRVLKIIRNSNYFNTHNISFTCKQCNNHWNT